MEEVEPSSLSDHDEVFDQKKKEEKKKKKEKRRSSWFRRSRSVSEGSQKAESPKSDTGKVLTSSQSSDDAHRGTGQEQPAVMNGVVGTQGVCVCVCVCVCTRVSVC